MWEQETGIGGGETGIRTPGTLSRSTVFKTAAFDHSATSPLEQGFRRVALDWQAETGSNHARVGVSCRTTFCTLSKTTTTRYGAGKAAKNMTGEPGKWVEMATNRPRRQGTAHGPNGDS